MNTRSYRKIYGYVGSEFIVSTITAFLFFFCVFFINQLLLLAEEILSKKVPFLDVARLILYSLPAITAFSAPFSALVGCLMAVGKFASSNEIIAFKASGISQIRLFLPIFFLGAIFAVLSFGANDYFLPWGTVNFTKLYRKLLFTHPELELESYSVKNYQDSILTNGLVDSTAIHQILILDKDPDGAKRIITSEKGYLDKSIPGVIQLILQGVSILSVGGKEKERYTYSFAEQMSYNILLKHVSISFRGLGPREMSSYDVYKEIQKKLKDLNERIHEQNVRLESMRYRYIEEYTTGIRLIMENPTAFGTIRENLLRLVQQIEQEKNRPVQDRSLQLYLIEFYKKFSIPAGCIFFIFFAFPTALFTKRSGKVVGFGLGLLVSIFYWGMLVAGQTLGVRTSFSPFLSMWIPNFVMLLLGILSVLVRRYR
ncbi:MAG: LptF/LptG family permease [Spirochaetes bacterium]|nr:LptF/LptG family permease [Spirochaetota bacterium]